MLTLKLAGNVVKKQSKNFLLWSIQQTEFRKHTNKKVSLIFQVLTWMRASVRCVLAAKASLRKMSGYWVSLNASSRIVSCSCVNLVRLRRLPLRPKGKGKEIFFSALDSVKSSLHLNTVIPPQNIRSFSTKSLKLFVERFIRLSWLREVSRIIVNLNDWKVQLVPLFPEKSTLKKT